MSYSGLVFDLLIGFILLNRSLRLYAMPPILIFNVTNSILFNIKDFW